MVMAAMARPTMIVVVITVMVDDDDADEVVGPWCVYRVFAYILECIR